MNLAAFIAVASCVAGCPPSDAGTIVVVGGAVKMVQFSVSSGVDYRLSYNPSRLALFFDAGASQPAPPNTTLQSPPAPIEHGDMNLDGRVDGRDVRVFVEVLLGSNTNPVLIAQADFDENGMVNSNDAALFVNALLAGPVPIKHGDTNLDGRVDGRDVQLFVAVLLGSNTNPILISQADFDENGVLDSSDTALFVNALLSGLTPTSTVTLYAQGLSASAGLCDTPVDILTDEYRNGTFVLAGTLETTVAALTLTPTSGAIGTPVTATISPAIAPLTFTPSTTAAWSGVFQPMVGSPSGAFQIQYSAAQVREQSASQAILIIGDGTFVNPPDAAAFAGPGTMNGILAISLEGNSFSKPAAFSPEFDAATWEQVDYPDGPGGSQPPNLDGEWPALPVLLLSNTPDPLNPTEQYLRSVSGFHASAAVRIDENPSASAAASTSINVDLISYDSNGTEVDRVANLILTRPPNDGDPDHIVYHNNLNIPIVLVDVDLNKNNFPNVTLLRVAGDGSAVIVLSAP